MSNFDTTATAILQARMGSSRLPGKVLLPLGGKPTVQCVFERILHCKRIGRIIVATTTKQEDNVIEELFRSLNVEVFRGSSEDPLDRYYNAANYFGVEHIVRVMADCPLVDPTIVDEVIEQYFKGDFDFCSLVGNFPTGLDTTVFSFNAIKLASKLATKKSEREHVTPFITNNKQRFRIGRYEKFKDLFHHRWVMDQPDDYKFIREIYKNFKNSKNIFTAEDILKLLNERPYLMKINSHIVRDQGYLQSLNADKKA